MRAVTNMDSIFRALQKGRDVWNKIANILLGRKYCTSNLGGNYNAHLEQFNGLDILAMRQINAYY